MQVISMVHFMRQELFSTYEINEIEAMIHYCFEEICGMGRIDVMTRSEDQLDAEVVERFDEVVDRLKQHEPIQYIFGHSRFYGLDIKLNKHVLIPRPETEELVHWMATEQRKASIHSILDIGSGSGCIALAMKDQFPEAQVAGVELSPEAIEVARANARHNKLDVHFVQSNILDQPHHLGAYDLIVSNPPYVTRAQMDHMLPNVLNHEPHLALFIEDDDPLKFYKAIAQFCKKHLQADGVLYLEINEDLAPDTVSLLESHNFTRTTIKKDLSGKFRMVKAMW